MIIRFTQIRPTCYVCTCILTTIKGKGLLKQAKVAQGVPGRLRLRIFLMFGTTRVVGCQPYAPAAFTPGEIPGTHFKGLSRPQGTWFCWGEPRKKSPVTPPGIDPGTVWLVSQCLNHYATPGSLLTIIYIYINNFPYIIKLILLTTFCKVFYVFPFNEYTSLTVYSITFEHCKLLQNWCKCTKKVGSEELVVAVPRLKSHRMTQTWAQSWATASEWRQQ
jgi:hypothetical protein